MDDDGGAVRLGGLRRRDALRLSGMGAVAVALGTGGLQSRQPDTGPTFFGNPFSLGVASGDPLPDGVVLWTRLAPDPLAEDGSGGLHQDEIGVRWEVAEDEQFSKVVRRGTATATPQLAYSVHPEVGGLRPGREYFYRFRVGPEISPVGRTKTAPAPMAPIDRFTLALVSCQSWTGGTFAAYANIAAEELDLVLHVGDYVYENADTTTLVDYRNLHALYKTSPELRSAHAAFPFVVTFDDHEVENDWAGEYSQKYPAVTKEEFLLRRAAAFQAYYEHLPLRRASIPNGPDMRMYRRLVFGDLAVFHVLDTRQYRSDQATETFIAPREPGSLDPGMTMTGPEQERWLLDGLERCQARWNVIAQQVVMAQYDYDPGAGESINHDQWDGYVAARDRVLDHIRQRDLRNVVVLSGDWHSAWANDLKADFADVGSATVATEFVGTSISSGCGWRDQVEAALSANPHVRFFDGARRGYTRCTLTRTEWKTDFMAVSGASDPQAKLGTLASFVVAAGVPGARRVPGLEVGDVKAGTMFAGRAATVDVDLTNLTSEPVKVTVTVQVPEGWDGGIHTQVLEPSSATTVAVPVVPPADPTPLAEVLKVAVSAAGTRLFGVFGDLSVVCVPLGDTVPLALDAGGPDSPVLAGYQRLSPADLWDPGRGYGWVGPPPGFRDRGAYPVLQRDFALGRDRPSTLRLFVPAGVHRVRLLTGDTDFASGNTIVHEGGQLLAESGNEIIPEGQFEWIGFDLDGGVTGRTADLELTGDLREGYWRLCALVMTPVAG